MWYYLLKISLIWMVFYFEYIDFYFYLLYGYKPNVVIWNGEGLFVDLGVLVQSKIGLIWTLN